MSIADQARANALPCEMVKYALRQTKDGIVVSFVVHPNDIPAALQTSHIGSRWMAALVQIGDDELPINKPREVQNNTAIVSPTLQPGTDKRPAGARRDWRDVQPAAQSGIRCSEPLFQAFLRETRKVAIGTPEEAAAVVRDVCGVNSRVEFGTKHAARMAWKALDSEFEQWKIADRISA